MSNPEQPWFERLAERLYGLRDDRGAMALMRRGLNGEPPLALFKYLAGLSPWQENTALIVGPLFAWHDEPGGKGTLGEALAKLRTAESDSLDRRFTALLNCNSEDLATHLRHAVGLLRGKNIPVDWSQLLRDVAAWDHEDRYVQRTWAKHFWAVEAVSDDIQPVIADPT